MRANNAPPHIWSAPAAALCFAEHAISGLRSELVVSHVSVPSFVDKQDVPECEVFPGESWTEFSVSVPSFVDKQDVPEWEVFPGESFDKMLAITPHNQAIEVYTLPVSLLAGSEQRCTDGEGCRWPEREDLRLLAPRVCCVVPAGATDLEIVWLDSFRKNAALKLGQQP